MSARAERSRSRSRGVRCALVRGRARSARTRPARIPSRAARAPARTGTRATDFAVRDTKGRTVRLSDYLGKQVVLLDFWATYCEPCLGEMPHLEQMYEENAAKGFTILALSMDGPETVAEVRSLASRNGLTFPVVLDEDSHASAIYNPKKSAPLSVLIDRQGNVVRVREGYNPGDEALVAADVARRSRSRQAA